MTNEELSLNVVLTSIIISIIAIAVVIGMFAFHPLFGVMGAIGSLADNKIRFSLYMTVVSIVLFIFGILEVLWAVVTGKSFRRK